MFYDLWNPKAIAFNKGLAPGMRGFSGFMEELRLLPLIIRIICCFSENPAA
jgi:hypothetical protein